MPWRARLNTDLRCARYLTNRKTVGYNVPRPTMKGKSSARLASSDPGRVQAWGIPSRCEQALEWLAEESRYRVAHPRGQGK